MRHEIRDALLASSPVTASVAYGSRRGIGISASTITSVWSSQAPPAVRRETHETKRESRSFFREVSHG